MTDEPNLPAKREPDNLPEPIEQPVATMARAEAKLKSEDMVIAAPMSFAGSAQRIWKLTKINGADNPAAQIALGTVAVIVTAGAWTLIAGWYLLWGIFLIPYRLIRRGQRKQKVAEARHRELLSAHVQGPGGVVLTPPGWYPAPEGEPGRRYWDGTAWTEHRAE